MRPIDADALKKVLQRNFGHTGGAAVLGQLIDIYPTLTLDDLRPTAKWDDSGRYRFGGKDGNLAIPCTNCGCALTEKEYKESVWNYCPVCGAKMGGGK